MKHTATPTSEDRVSTATSDASGGGRKRVLVVDDFDDAREMYAEYLEFVGFEVDTARDGMEAVEKAQSSEPDIILMDLSLPVMDGWEATRRIKQDLRTRDIPVMALTGHVLAGNAEHAREAGADEFVAKPCLPQDLENKIRNMLKPSKARKREGQEG
ncbi:response regulator [Myxococcus sp. CA051A]|uniref:Response regulator n=1 Tax=Myxococcus llanfairpwllgwyngyllgogerychwyrndrobwllllantysiliogogogochensis TaxID=2590453 RepID=A0A540WR62_9BACT|nr:MULTISPECIES: response regulator [Myxococcus]NTX05335.1 response regulator [Myxococcus sp. CA040A]NTX09962.1 response regulator [Myxococcus sp. CA056]NTX35325.1 response regulator [Myxococcus sp. CA033]NTX56705.1 response regulator [Myxococcus sp. CA039A]NTX64424.1 response regulator [Myxococcus sp. CA051A]